MLLDGRRATGRLHLRYEDVAQDGRIQLEAIPVSLGVIWRELLVGDTIQKELLGRGVLPILTRFEIEGAPGPFAVESKVDVAGGYSLAHEADDAGRVVRIFLDMDAELHGTKGRTNLPPPEDEGQRALVGRLRAEHIFTRPFAALEQRKVLALPIEGKEIVPGARRAWRPPATALDPPAGAQPLEGALVDDRVTTVLGLAHTDSNQHVNSLVYPRLFEEASLRRLASLGKRTDVLARKVDIAFRRPSFAGEKLGIALRAFAHEGRVVCAGVFFGDGERDLDRARVYAQMTFE
jgi:hypothetical protein